MVPDRGVESRLQDMKDLGTSCGDCGESLPGSSLATWNIHISL